MPKRNIVGFESKVYILDFFGSKDGLRRPLSGQGGLVVPPKRILTAFGSPENTFLGYHMANSSSVTDGSPVAGPKLKQGVVWGKDSKHFAGNTALLRAVADDVTLVSTATAEVFTHRNVQWVGHQSAAGWMDILRRSR